MLSIRCLNSVDCAWLPEWGCGRIGVKTGSMTALIAGGLLALGCNLTQVIQQPEEPQSEPEDMAVTVAISTQATGNTAVSRPAAVGSTNLLQPEDFTYLGAFRLPGGEDRPKTFAYGGNAMTFNPDGDASGAGDGFPGSLFVMGHDRIAYGDVPDGNQVAEISIPVPVPGKNLEAMPTAEFLQDFSDVTAGAFTDLEEIPKVGMTYLNRTETGSLIHLAWGQHLQPQDIASHAWFSPDLEHPDLTGFWFIGNQDLYSVNGYMFEIPADWADAYTGGRYLGTGRMRDAGQGAWVPHFWHTVPGRMTVHRHPTETIWRKYPCCCMKNLVTLKNSSIAWTVISMRMNGKVAPG